MYEELIFFWDTICEAGEFFLIIGGIALMALWTKIKK